MKIVITGTPGVGKHTIALELSNILGKIQIMDINNIILSENLLISSQRGDIITDINRSFDFLSLMLSKQEYHNTIIVGHLAPYVIDPRLVDFVVVLRRSPYELKKIYESRIYSQNKIRDNIVSEILGILSYDTLKKFDLSKISEFEILGSISPSSSAQKIADIYLNRELRTFGVIDWFPLIQNDPEILKFLTKKI